MRKPVLKPPIRSTKFHFDVLHPAIEAGRRILESDRAFLSAMTRHEQISMGCRTRRNPEDPCDSHNGRSEYSSTQHLSTATVESQYRWAQEVPQTPGRPSIVRQNFRDWSEQVVVDTFDVHKLIT
jgi:hypothetical protein